MASGDPSSFADVAARVGTTTLTTTSTTWTSSESVALMTVTASLINGWTYKVQAWLGIQAATSAATEISAMRLREDTATGTQGQLAIAYMPIVSVNATPIYLYYEYTASATANKSWVVTGQRTNGTGTHSIAGTATRPSYLFVDRIVS